MKSMIDILKTSPRSRIRHVGVEFEGAWLAPTFRLVHDGSVFHGASTVPYTTAEGEVVSLMAGELPSAPMPIDRLAAYVALYYPLHVDETCGLHLHMSLKSAYHYQVLLTQAYTYEMVAGLKRWATARSLPSTHPIWPRLRGENQYCQPRFYGDSQVKSRSKSYNRGGGSRYTFINYCYGLHSTVECRGLPMFADWETALSALDEVIALTNAFLVFGAQREPKVIEDISMAVEGTSEHIVEHLDGPSPF